MVDIQTVSIMLASASVIAGVVYYALQIRHQTRIRKTDLIVRLSPWFNVTPKELQEAGNTLSTLEYRDYDDFVERYGSLWSGKPEPNAVMLGCNYMDGIGMLLKRKLVDIDTLVDAYGESGAMAWEKVKPLVEGFRKQFKMPRAFEWFEYLYNEMKKREQKLQQKGVKNG
jgi:hypothetical protein